MPMEVISRSTCADGPNNQFTVQWGKSNVPDPSVILASWCEALLPNGERADWMPGAAWDLDRETINKLIRVLRRARDQAYGRDE